MQALKLPHRRNKFERSHVVPKLSLNGLCKNAPQFELTRDAFFLKRSDPESCCRLRLRLGLHELAVIDGCVILDFLDPNRGAGTRGAQWIRGDGSN